MPPPIPTWYYDPRTRRYHDNVTHRFLAFATVEGLMEKSLDAFHREADVLSALIADKALPIGEWEAGMQAIVRRSYEANCILARGGLAQVTDEDREKVSELLEFQFERLDRFAGQIEEEHWTARGGAIRRRARMYVNSGRQIFWYIETQNQIEIGGKWERWVLIGGVGDEGTCADCIALSAKGWVEIGTLPQPCSGATVCLSSCRCSKRYSKAAKRPRMRGALRAILKAVLVLRLMEHLGFSPKLQGRSYPAPHCGAPGEVGGSRPREECAPGAEKAVESKVPEFVTLRQAEQWARENLASHVDYGDSVSVEFAQSVNETVADVLDHCEWTEISITGRRGLAGISIVDSWNSQADIAGAGKIEIGNMSWAYGDRPERVHLLSAYMFDDGIEGAVRHELGHIFDEHNSAEFSNLLKAADWQEKFGVTKRARDNRGECVAENFALYSAGKRDGMHPDMITLLRRLTTWP